MRGLDDLQNRLAELEQMISRERRTQFELRSQVLAADETIHSLNMKVAELEARCLGLSVLCREALRLVPDPARHQSLGSVLHDLPAEAQAAGRELLEDLQAAVRGRRRNTPIPTSH
jgi:hypothetical protein